MKRQNTFKFAPFSIKQKKLLTWWQSNSPVSDYDGIIADGAIRSGKSLAMSISFVFWAMSTFNQMNFAMCGKTVGSLRRNVLSELKKVLPSRGYSVHDRRADNIVVITRGNVENYFHIFGGKDEASQDLIQGITLAGILFDEVALQVQSFVEQGCARCSVEGSKYWFNCNPGHPRHWFNMTYICERLTKNLLYLHFTMDDNLSLSEYIKDRYKRMYSGVFALRYILGLWVRAEGAIYTMFNLKDVGIDYSHEPYYIDFSIGIDIGGRDATVYTLLGYTANYAECHVLSTWYDKQGVEERTSYDDYCNEFFAWVAPWLKKYPAIKNVFVESADKLFRIMLIQRRPKFAMCLKFYKSYKGESINDRIELTCMLLNEGRLKLAGIINHLPEAFESAKWDAKHADKRLDDGSSDIDSLDSFEYALIPYKKFLVRNLIKRAA